MRIPLLVWPAALVWVVCAIFAGPEPYAPVDPPSWVFDIRHHFTSAVATFGGDGGALLPGLVLGDTTAVSESLTNSMRVSSLAHLTAVSGANCAVIVVALYGLSALAGLGIWWRSGIAAAGLGVFVVLVGAEPSVVRASVMAVIGLIAVAVGRPAHGIAILAAAVILALLWAPSLSRSIGFALSVAATLGLLVLTIPLTDLFARWVPRRVATVVAVPVAAHIAVQPLLLVFAPSISTFGVIANVLAAPLAPVATLAGLAAVLTSFLPWVSISFVALGWLASSAIALVARSVAALPAATIPWPPGGGGILVATACTILTVWAIITHRRSIAVVAGVAVATALSTTVGAGAVSWSSAPNEWTIAQCNVGQGDAVVVRDSGRVALVDTGRDERLLRSCLDQLGIGTIDLLVLTHFDIDHAGAYGVVVGRVRAVLHGPTDGPADERALVELTSAGATLIEGIRGVSGELGTRPWRVLWPSPAFPTEPGNPASVVVEFGGCPTGCATLLDLGDLPAREQRQMLSLGGVRAIDVVKVSHHGSRDQFADLYARLRASVALVGVGDDNEYGHPTDATLALLRATGSAVMRSDRSGVALVDGGGTRGLSVWTERSG